MASLSDDVERVGKKFTYLYMYLCMCRNSQNPAHSRFLM